MDSFESMMSAKDPSSRTGSGVQSQMSDSLMTKTVSLPPPSIPNSSSLIKNREVLIINKDVLAEYSGPEYINGEYRLISTLSYTDAYVISGSENGTICMWDLVETDMVRTLNAHTKPVTCIAYHKERHEMVSGSQDGKVKVWV